MLHTYYYQRHPSFLASKTPPSYVGGYLHTLHDFFGFLKNENHQAQFAYMKTMSLKNGIHSLYMDLSDFVDKTTG